MFRSDVCVVVCCGCVVCVVVVFRGLCAFFYGGVL